MKDFSEADWERSAPHDNALEKVEFCLNRLFADKKLTVNNLVARDCSYEELIAALMSAREELRAFKKWKEELEELSEQ